MAKVLSFGTADCALHSGPLGSRGTLPTHVVRGPGFSSCFLFSQFESSRTARGIAVQNPGLSSGPLDFGEYRRRSCREISSHNSLRRLGRRSNSLSGIRAPGPVRSSLVRPCIKDCNGGSSPKGSLDRNPSATERSVSYGNAGSVPGLESYCGRGENLLGLSMGLQSRSRRRSVTTRATTATRQAALRQASGGHSPRASNNWLATSWANILAFFAGLAAKLESISIGWLDLLTTMQIVLLAAAAVGVFFAGKKIWEKVQGGGSEESEGGGGGGGGGGGPMEILARGATTMQSNMGPWSATDLGLGLTAMGKVTEKKPPSLPGKEVEDLVKDEVFLLRAQHWRAISEAVYAPDSATFSLFSTLPESAIVHSEWQPDTKSFRPAYCVFVDAPYGAVVLSVRGTSDITDMLLNSGTSVEPVDNDGGVGHGGFVHATGLLYDEVLPHIEKAFREHGGHQRQMNLVVVGHSMGAAVGTLTALKLRDRYPELECWGFCPPACMSLDLAKQCKKFTTSFVAAYDVVPRFSLHTVERLRKNLQEFDFEEVERVAKGDEDYDSIKTAIDTFRKMQETRANAEENIPDVEGPEGAGEMITDKGKKIKAAATDLKKKVSEFLQGIKQFWGRKADSEGEGEGEGDDGEEVNENPPPLFPPGRILILGSDPPGGGKLPEQRMGVSSQRSYGSYPNFDEKRKVKWRMLEAEQEDFEDIVVSPWLVSDHMLGNLCEAIAYFQSQVQPVVKT